MRLHLTLAILTAILLVITLRSEPRYHFGFSNVQELADRRAHDKYVPIPNVLPPPLKNLTSEQENGIFWNDAYRLWRKKGLTFQVDFYHINKAFPRAPSINTVDRKGTHPLGYSPIFFHFPNIVFTPPLR